jgi:hypothetical protein
MLAQNLDEIQNTSGLPIWHLYVQPSFFITVILKYVFPIAGILMLVYLILGGFQLMVSRGEPKAIEGGKGKITNALLGFFIILVSYWLVSLLARVLGLDESIGDIFRL